MADSNGTTIPHPLPKSVIIIGAGIFGLSTALAIAKRYPETAITVIDRLTPPVIDGSSVDTTRCIRSDYIDPIYATLAKKSQTILESDPALQPYLFKQGMTFVCDSLPGPYTKIWHTQKHAVEANNPPSAIVHMPTRAAVFAAIHGSHTPLPDEASLPDGKARWNIGYCNLNNSFIDARASVEVYYHRCLETPSITFRCGTPVDRILTENRIATGVLFETGETLHADLTIVAAGAWSPRLVDLSTRVSPIAHEVAYLKLTPSESAQFAHMSITTNLSTGLNLFPPYQGEVKILRRSVGYVNTIKVPHPEDSSKMMEISYPRTIVSNPGDVIPEKAEFMLRENLREIMPGLADRPFDRTKLCWISTTPTADFLIAPHPRLSGIHLATGGSAHAWKFLAIIGDLVVDSIEGVLSPELVEKWSYERNEDGKDDNAPRMHGDPEELRDVVRSSG